MDSFVFSSALSPWRFCLVVVHALLSLINRNYPEPVAMRSEPAAACLLAQNKRHHQHKTLSRSERTKKQKIPR